jgi:chromate transporter
LSPAQSLKSLVVRPTNIKKFRNYIFLRDIFFLATTAFGGPQAHFSNFLNTLVKDKRYITEHELLELNSLCYMLPGPTSTQTITAIGFKLGGPFLAFMALLVWVTPATLIMTGIVIAVSYFDQQKVSLDFLKFIGPMALGFIIHAAILITRLFATSRSNIILMIAACLIAVLSPLPFTFPLLLVMGGVVSNFTNKNKLEKVKPIINVRWANFILFVSIFAAAAILGAVTGFKPILLFENTYRYGSLVFGGGNVLIPMMFEQYVEYKKYLSPEDFTTGVGMMQAIPGPLFSLSTYTNGMAMKDSGMPGQLLGCLIGTIAIFLPGTLLIFFIYPLWNQLKDYRPIKKALEGINATSAGLVVAAAYIIFKPVAFSNYRELDIVIFNLDIVSVNKLNLLIILITCLLLFYTRLPRPVIVLMTLLAGFLL